MSKIFILIWKIVSPFFWVEMFHEAGAVVRELFCKHGKMNPIYCYTVLVDFGNTRRETLKHCPKCGKLKSCLGHTEGYSEMDRDYEKKEGTFNLWKERVNRREKLFFVTWIGVICISLLFALHSPLIFLVALALMVASLPVYGWLF